MMFAVNACKNTRIRQQNYFIIFYSFIENNKNNESNLHLSVFTQLKRQIYPKATGKTKVYES